MAKKMKQSEIKRLVTLGLAKDVTNASTAKVIPESYDRIAYSKGINGVNGLLFKGKSGKLYAVTRRSEAIHLFKL